MSTPATKVITSDINSDSKSKDFCEQIIKLLDSEDGLDRTFSSDQIDTFRKNNHETWYVDKFGVGVLYHLIKRIPLGESISQFDDVLRFCLQQGANPLILTWKNESLAVDQTLQNSLPLELIPKTHLHSILELLFREKCTKLGTVAIYNELFAKSLVTLCEFGAGLLRWTYRLNMFDGYTETNNAINLVLKKLHPFFLQDIILSQEELICPSEYFVFSHFFQQEIVLLGRTVSNHRRVWIITLSDLEKILKGKKKHIEIPNIDQITRFVLETPEDDLPPGLKSLFKTYASLPKKSSPLETLYDKHYQEFDNLLQKTLMCTDITIPDSPEISHCIEVCPPWLRTNAVRVLELFSKQEESYFFNLLTSLRIYLSDTDFRQWVSTQSLLFSEQSKKLIMFHCVRNGDFTLFNTLIEKGYPLEGELGYHKNTLILELAETSKDLGRDSTLKIMEAIINNSKNKTQTVNYKNILGASVLGLILSKENSVATHMDSIRLLLKNGASPYHSWQGRNLLNGILRWYGEPSFHGGTFDDFQFLLSWGLGLVRREYRFNCFDEYSDISRDFSVIDSKILLPSFNEGSGPDEKDKVTLYYESVILFIAERKDKTKNYRILDAFIYSLEKLSYVLKHEEEYELDHLSIIRENVLQADDSVIEPKVKRVFAEKVRECKVIGKTLQDYFSCDISDLVVSFMFKDVSYKRSMELASKIKKLFASETKRSAELERATESEGRTETKMKSELSCQSSNSARDNFILQQYKAWQWNKKANGDPPPLCKITLYGEFYRLYKLDCTLVKNITAMKELIENGLISQIMINLKLESFYYFDELMEKPEYLALLVDAGLNLNPFPDRLLSALKTALKIGNMKSVEILIEANIDLELEMNDCFAQDKWDLIACAREGKCEKEFLELLARIGKQLPVSRKEKTVETRKFL